MPTERAPIHLRVLGQDTLVEADVETGPARLGALLGLSHELSRAGLGAARMQSMLEGKPMSCEPGCAHCCHELVTLAPVEAVALAELVEALPDERREIVRARFRAAIDRMVELGIRLADAAPGDHRLVAVDAREPVRGAFRRYFEAKIPCPMLEDARCSIYDQRPTVCREHAVSSAPALCDTRSDKMEGLPRPLAVFDALLDLGAKFGTAPRESIPLPVALEWAAVHGGTLTELHDAEEMFHALVAKMQSAQDAADEPGPGPARSG